MNPKVPSWNTRPGDEYLRAAKKLEYRLRKQGNKRGGTRGAVQGEWVPPVEPAIQALARPVPIQPQPMPAVQPIPTETASPHSPLIPRVTRAMLETIRQQIQDTPVVSPEPRTGTIPGTPYLVQAPVEIVPPGGSYSTGEKTPTGEDLTPERKGPICPLVGGDCLGTGCLFWNGFACAIRSTDKSLSAMVGQGSVITQQLGALMQRLWQG